MSIRTTSTLILTGFLLTLSIAGPKKKIKLLTFRFLSKLDYEYGKTPIPKKLKRLDGKYVKIRGYMAPVGKTKGMQEFILIPVTLACCFKEAPPVQEQVWITLKNPLKADYVDHMIMLKGTLKVEEKIVDGVLKSLTHLHADVIDMII